MKCPHCGASSNDWGYYRGSNRIFCLKCKRWYYEEECANRED